jgi:hypothetical protein
MENIITNLELMERILNVLEKWGKAGIDVESEIQKTLHTLFSNVLNTINKDK